MIHAIALILLGLSGSTQAPAPGVEPCDASLALLFAPARPVLGRYEVCTDDRTFEIVRQAGWTVGPVEHLEPLDAFGSAGSYDRAKIAQLYGGQRVSVAHGWRQTTTQFESVTLLTPYPDAGLSRLVAGTLIIRWILEEPPR